MFLKQTLLGLAAALILTGCQSADSGDREARTPEAPVAKAETQAKESQTASFDIAFITHLEADLPEQDVFIEREKGSNEVHRVTKGDNDMNATLYKTAVAVEHDPFDEDAVGPHPKGEPLGMTLGEWLKARGTGTYTFKDGVGSLNLKFTDLVPNGVYTMWHVFTAIPSTDPFAGTLDLPLGPRDGSESVFTADADGNAQFVHSFRPGLQLSDTWTTSLLAIAYHSDGKTYGGRPGPFGLHTHVPLFAKLPKREGIE